MVVIPCNDIDFHVMKAHPHPHTHTLSLSLHHTPQEDQNLQPRVVRALQREIKDLIKRPPAGVTFVPNEEDSISEVMAELVGPDDTPYAGGRFMVKLVLGRDYPQSPPKGYFLTKIYHPNVEPRTGAICVNTLKRDWSEDMGISHILKVVWCLLVYPFPESSLNDEAGKLFLESFDSYARKAKLLTKVHAMKGSSTASSCDGAEACTSTAAATASASVSSSASSSSSSASASAASSSSAVVILPTDGSVGAAAVSAAADGVKPKPSAKQKKIRKKVSGGIKRQKSMKKKGLKRL